jgi:DNA helicase II / ATP-dependent DNA helicase PcrA
MIDLSSLNESQRRAVEWIGNRLLVLAGPGSGKTRVLTMRIARIIDTSPMKNFRVLGLTFTTKAADEMRSRARLLVSNGGSRMWLGTFHALAAEILRQHGNHIGLRPDFRIINQDSERKNLLREVLTGLRDAGKNVPAPNTNVLPSMDEIFKLGLQPADAARAFRDSAFGARMQPIYAAYLERLRRENAADFGALLVFALELLDAKPIVAQQLRAVFPHICVDEFQDTNLAQYELLCRLVGRETNLFVVADDDQIIYAWNGASTDRLRALQRDFNVAILQLPENYRCPEEVIRVANALIGHNMDRSAEKAQLTAIKPPGASPCIRVRSFEDADQEAAWVAQDIAARPNLDECVVLGRTGKLLDGVAKALADKGITVARGKRKDDFTSAPLVFTRSLLRLMCDRVNREAMAALSKTLRVLEGVELDVDHELEDYMQAWIDAAKDHPALESATREFLIDAERLIASGDYLRIIIRTFAWIEAIRERVEAQDETAFVAYDEDRSIWDNQQSDILARYEGEHVPLGTFLQELDLEGKIPEVPEGAVRCYTIHIAKGLEFEHVYVIGLADEYLPSYRALQKGDTSPEIEEERRSCFVAITRCEASLTLTYARRYAGYAKNPSRFLEEMNLLEESIPGTLESGSTRPTF